MNLSIIEAYVTYMPYTIIGMMVLVLAFYAVRDEYAPRTNCDP